VEQAVREMVLRAPAWEPQVWQESGALASRERVWLAWSLLVRLAQEMSASMLQGRVELALRLLVWLVAQVASAFPSWELVEASAVVVPAVEFE
jgi:hypothetical protein